MTKTVRHAAALFTTAVLCLAATACTPSAGTGAGPADSNTSGGGCPLSAEALSTATGLTFELSDTRKDQKLETLPDIAADVCIFTSPSNPQDAGDPLVLRVDTVTGANAAAVRTDFERSCTDNGGTLKNSTVKNTKTCARGGYNIEGSIRTGDRAVEVYFVNALTKTAKSLTPSLDKVLASVK